MARLTITLPDDVHRDLKIRSAGTGLPIGRLLLEAIEDQRRLAQLRLAELSARAAAHAAAAKPRLTEQEIMELAVAETRAARKERSGRRAG